MLAGNQENTFMQWIKEHQGVIFKVVRANVDNLEDQNDLYQEIAFQVWLSIPSYQKKAKVSTWIYRVALNTSMVWHRSHNKHRHMRDSLCLINEKSEREDEPSKTLENREKLDWLYQEIRKLSKVDRALALLYLDEFNYREIADILGISVNNVGVKLHRIKTLLCNSSARRDQ